MVLHQLSIWLWHYLSAQAPMPSPPFFVFWHQRKRVYVLAWHVGRYIIKITRWHEMLDGKTAILAFDHGCVKRHIGYMRVGEREAEAVRGASARGNI